MPKNEIAKTTIKKSRRQNISKICSYISPKQIEEVGWKRMELEVCVNDNKLVVKPKEDTEKKARLWFQQALGKHIVHGFAKFI